MPKIFISPGDICGGSVILTGDKARHVSKSLRMSPGERLVLCDGQGFDYVCTITSSGEDVVLAVNDRTPSSAEPPYRVTVYQALSKGDHFDTAVRKSVEFGAYAIFPVITERSTVRLTKSECSRKSERWQKISESAAEQSGRGIIPEIGGLLTLTEAAERAAEADLALFCYENERNTTIKERLEEFSLSQKGKIKCPEIVLLVGPEGGFSETERETAESAMLPVSLGPRILRTESAAPCALACISMALEM